MNRQLIIEAILEWDRQGRINQDAIRLGLSYLSDTSLLAFAIQLGIDTDAILNHCAICGEAKERATSLAAHYRAAHGMNHSEAAGTVRASRPADFTPEAR
jgi:hypothetical protein